MQLIEYNTSKNVFEIVGADEVYPTIKMLNNAVKIHIKGLLPLGISGYLIYLYIIRGNVIIIAINPIRNNINPISSILCDCDVMAPIVIPTYTIQ